MTKFLNISVDTNLGGSSASDEVVSSQKALKTYIDNHSGGGSVAIDNNSITKNTDDEIQTVGVIDQANSSNAIKTWTGTSAQYQSLVSGGTVDNHTLYNITDDTNPTQALLEAIYPVGSIYIGTMSTCPMSALFGTWTLVSSGRVLQGSDANHTAGTTIEAGLPNIEGDPWTGGDGTFNPSGAFYKVSDGSNIKQLYTNVAYPHLKFDASRSSSIYGNSDTVQPPAYVVNIWQRSA